MKFSVFCEIEIECDRKDLPALRRDLNRMSGSSDCIGSVNYSYSIRADRIRLKDLYRAFDESRGIDVRKK